MFAQNEMQCEVAILRHYVTKLEVMHALGSNIHVQLVNRGGGGGGGGGKGLTRMQKDISVHRNTS